jgi:hypothetical protein
LAVREYDAGSFLVRYTAMAKVDPVFTHVSRSMSDREDGAVYTTAEPPGGLFGTKPGRGFSIYVLPTERFGLSRPDLSELASSLPSKLKATHPEEVFSAHVRNIASRQWCEVTSCEAGPESAVTGVSYYAFADSRYLLYAAWTFPRPISKARVAEEDQARLEILGGFEVRKKEPNQPSEPIPLTRDGSP